MNSSIENQKLISKSIKYFDVYMSNLKYQNMWQWVLQQNMADYKSNINLEIIYQKDYNLGKESHCRQSQAPRHLSLLWGYPSLCYSLPLELLKRENHTL